MEYKELHERESYLLQNNLRRQQKLTARLKKSREIYAKHLEAAEQKGYEYALFESYMDDDGEYGGPEPEIAQGIWDDENLGFTKDLVEKKAAEISRFEALAKELETYTKRRRGLISAIVRYNPSRRQANSRIVQENFFFAPDSSWMREHGEKRSRQGKRTNSMFKTFQDIFTRHNYRIIPKAEGKFGGIDFDKLDLDPVIVDPERMSDYFLKEFENRRFGLYSPPSDKHELDRLRAKDAMIPALKIFFQHHVTPTPRSSWDDKDLNYRILVVNGYNPEHDGKIIYPHYDTSEEECKRRKVMTFYSSAYAARRAAARLFPGYEKESSGLLKAQLCIKQARVYIEKATKEKAKSEEHLEDARKNLCKAITYLLKLTDEPESGTGESAKKDDKQKKPRIRNKYKVSAYNRLFSTANLKDKLERLNVGASLAKLVPVYKDLQRRLNEVDSTSIAGPENQNTLNSTITQSEGVLKSYEEAFKTYVETNGDKQQFEALKGSLQKLKVRPFNLYANALIEYLRDINKTPDKTAKIEIASKALTITRLFDLQKHIEDMMYKLDTTDALDIKSLFEKMDQFISLVSRCQIKGEEEKFKVLKELLEAKKDEFQKFYETSIIYAGFRQSFKDKLKEIDFEKLLRDIK